MSPLLWPLVVVGFLQLRHADHRAPPALLFPLCVIPAFLIGATVYQHGSSSRLCSSHSPEQERRRLAVGSNATV